MGAAVRGVLKPSPGSRDLWPLAGGHAPHAGSVLAPRPVLQRVAVLLEVAQPARRVVIDDEHQSPRNGRYDRHAACPRHRYMESARCRPTARKAATEFSASDSHEYVRFGCPCSFLHLIC